MKYAFETGQYIDDLSQKFSMKVFTRNGVEMEICVEEYFHLLYNCLSSQSPEMHDLIMANYAWDPDFYDIPRKNRNHIVQDKYRDCRYRTDDAANLFLPYHNALSETDSYESRDEESYDIEDLEILLETDSSAE